MCLPVPAWQWTIQPTGGADSHQAADPSASEAAILNPNPPLRAVAGQALLVADAEAVRWSSPQMQIRQERQKASWLGDAAGNGAGSDEGMARSEQLALHDTRHTSDWTATSQPGSIARALQRIARASKRRTRRSADGHGGDAGRLREDHPRTGMPRRSVAAVRSSRRGLGSISRAGSSRRVSHAGDLHGQTARDGRAGDDSSSSDDESPDAAQPQVLPVLVATSGIRAVASAS